MKSLYNHIKISDSLKQILNVELEYYINIKYRNRINEKKRWYVWFRIRKNYLMFFYKKKNYLVLKLH